MWTEERVEKLKVLWAEGQSASLIASELGGITRNAVLGKIHRLKEAPRAPRKCTVRKVTEPRVRVPRLRLQPEPRPAGFATSLPFEQPENPITFFDLRASHCRWPVGQDDAHLYCGGTVADHYSYCTRHCRMAYRGVGRAA